MLRSAQFLPRRLYNGPPEHRGFSLSEDILSQEEIDALLTGVDDGDIATSAAAQGESFSAYDLTSQDKIVRSRMPTLEVVNERIARHLRAALFSMLKRGVEVECESFRIQKYGEFIESLAAPCSINLLAMKPLRGQAMLVMEQALVVKLVDNYFGGEGHEPKIQQRDFTATELRVVNLFITHALQGIREAWRQVAPLDAEVIGSESNPSMVSVAAPTDAVILNIFKLEFDNFSGDLQFVIPYNMIDPVKESLMTTSKAANQSPEEGWASSIRRDILRANVALGCTVAQREISLRDVVGLSTGDVIPIEIPEALVLEANGAPIFKVKLGKSRGNLALEIIGRTSIEQIE